MSAFSRHPKSLLKSFDSALKREPPAKAPPAPGPKKWLKEATLSRITDRLLNSAELVALTTGKDFSVSADKLDDSGLTEEEKRLVAEWVAGRVSGRHCLCLFAAVEASERATSTRLTPDNLLPLLATMVSFPTSVVEKNANVLLDKVFGKPPLVALGEVLKDVTRISKEKSLKALRTEVSYLTPRNLYIP